MKLTLRQLEIFVAIARTGKVSRAADRMAMSQSAASSALVELERQFDCTLFERIGKTLRINSLGQGLLPIAESLLTQARDLESYLAGGRPGPLAVAATLTIGNYLAPLLVADYTQQHPDSPVRLQVANTATVVERLLALEVDLALIEGEATHPDLVLEPWLDDELVVFCAPGHEFARVSDGNLPGKVSTTRLTDQHWVLRERGSSTRSLFDRELASKLKTFRMRLEFEHTEAIKRAVESGLGIGCLSRLALREALRRGSLVEVPTPQFDLRRRFHIAHHRQRSPSRAMAAFAELCRALAAGATRTADLALPFIP